MNRMCISCNNDEQFKELLSKLERIFYINTENVLAYKNEEDEYIYCFEYANKSTFVGRKRKLSQEQEKEIYSKKLNGARTKDIANEYNISKGLIYKICERNENPFYNEKEDVIIKHVDSKNDNNIDMAKYLDKLIGKEQ